jgi:malate dehydrogenase
MEIEDTASPYLNDVIITDDPNIAFDQGDYFFFLGAFPRGPGMERRDLLEKNAEIFMKQGDALNKAAKDAKVLVVGNPCNTNAYILHKKLKRDDVLITSMSMLDHLRAQGFIARSLNVDAETIENIIIWGNHSKALFVDTHFSFYKEECLYDVFKKKNLLETLQSFTQKRGEEVIKARGKSSAASAANAALVHMSKLMKPSLSFFSCGVYSKNNPYGLDQDLFFSMPCLIDAEGKLKVVSHLNIQDYKKELEPSLKELIEEREFIKGLIN